MKKESSNAKALFYDFLCPSLPKKSERKRREKKQRNEIKREKLEENERSFMRHVLDVYNGHLGEKRADNYSGISRRIKFLCSARSQIRLELRKHAE
jgi:hypothetical protein